MGYPSGEWHDSTARIVAATERLIFLAEVDERAGPGISGGPLLWNGKLVGACSGKGGSDEVDGVTVIGGIDRGDGNYGADAGRYIAWAELKKSFDASRRYIRNANVNYKARRVFVFSATNCPPCAALERDIAAGHFRQFDLIVHKFDANTRWQTTGGAEAYQSMAKAIGRQPNSFPIIWVEGTAEYREGYSPQRRGGLVGFLGSILEGIARIVVGEVNPPNPPSIVPVAAPVSQPDSVVAPPASLVPEGYEDLIASMAEVRDDLKALKEGGPIARVKALASIKSDIAAAKSEAVKAKEKAEGDPASLLYGLFGIASGLIHRRLAA